MTNAAKRALLLAVTCALGIGCASPTGRTVCLDLVGSDDLNIFDGEPHAVVESRWVQVAITR